MKKTSVIIIAALLATALGSAVFAAHHVYVCEYCGIRIGANSMPQPGNSCRGNPKGQFHSWVIDNEDGRSHQWICAYCGRRVGSSLMPQPGNTCPNNPDGGRYHKWLKND